MMTLLARKGWTFIPSKNVHPGNYTQVNCTWLPMGTSFCQLLYAVSPRAFNHGAIVPKEPHREKEGNQPLAFSREGPKAHFLCVCFEIFRNIPEWKFSMIPNKLLMEGKLGSCGHFLKHSSWWICLYLNFLEKKKGLIQLVSSNSCNQQKYL